jgi:membrane protein YdbS with pleckstrin-like domain
MNDQTIHETGLHKGFLLTYALSNILVLILAAFLGWALTFPLRILPAGLQKLWYFAYLPITLIAVPALLGWIPVLIAFQKSVVVFTKDSVRFNTGLFFRTEGYLSWNEVESIFVKRGPLGSLFGYGTLVVVGKAGTPFLFPFMPDFEKLRAMALMLCMKQVVPNLQAWSVHEAEPGAILQESFGSCGNCNATLNRDDIQICQRSSSRFANQMLCSKCRSYAPRH